MSVCTVCGSQLKPSARFCSICGQPVAAGQSQYPVPTTRSSGSALITVVLVDRQRNQYAVTDQMTIGRDPINQLHLDVVDISRIHAQILWQLTAWVIMDLNSANGTYVNDQRVMGSTALSHGDRLRFGNTTELLFIDPSQARTTSTHQPLPQTQRVVSPVIPAAIPNLPAHPTPQLKNWDKQLPLVEGYIVSRQGPVMVEKDGKVGRALLSIGLGLISPALAFIPFAVGKNQIMITQLRVERYPPDPQAPQAAVTIVGDQTSSVDTGDLVAVWGKEDEGTIYAVTLYNYNTGAIQRFKR